MTSLTMAIFRRFARYGRPLLNFVEKRLASGHQDEKAAHAPIFIVGAPRSGSTLLYQMLTHRFDLLYTDNLSALFYRHPLSGLWLSQKLYRRKPHNCFRSFLGNTMECGPHAPSECGDFWYRWLSREKHYCTGHELTLEQSNQIRDFFTAAINRWNKPFLVKNLAMGQRMALIQRFAPNARFIFIKRQPLFTAQSIWQSRKRLGLEPHRWWSIMPKNYQELIQLNAHKQIAAQIYYLEKQILSHRCLFPVRQFITVKYETLCRQPDQTINRLSQFIGENLAELPGGETFPNPDFQEKQKIGDYDFKLLEKETGTYDWENYELQ